MNPVSDIIAFKFVGHESSYKFTNLGVMLKIGIHADVLLIKTRYFEKDNSFELSLGDPYSECAGWIYLL